jgi:hypothetical protein
MKLLIRVLVYLLCGRQLLLVLLKQAVGHLASYI